MVCVFALFFTVQKPVKMCKYTKNNNSSYKIYKVLIDL